MKTSALLISSLVAAALAGCAAKAAPQQNAIPIRVEAATSSAAQPLYEGPGSVTPAHTYHLAFEIPGRISALNADVGDRVRAGEVLATLDASDYLAQVQEAQARASAAQAQAVKARNGARPQERDAARLSVDAAQAELDRARAAATLAHANLARYDSLFADGAISEQQHDAAATADRDAQDRVAASRAALASAQSNESIVLQGARDEDRTSADAEAAATAAGARLARVMLAKNELIAPADAYVESRAIELGDEASPGSIAFVLVSAATPEVRVSVPERFLLTLRSGTRATVDVGGAKYSGAVSRVEPAADAETRTGVVRVAVPGLRSHVGAVVTAALGEQRHSDATSIPLDAVLTDANGVTSVLLYDASRGSVISHPIEVASIESDRALVNGLQAGVMIVTAGQHEAHPGDRVRVLDSGSKQP